MFEEFIQLENLANITIADVTFPLLVFFWWP